MRANRSCRTTQQSARPKWASVTFIFVLAAAMAGAALWPRRAEAAVFTLGPSVRVNPNQTLEFKWRTDVDTRGTLRVYDNPDGTGNPVFEIPSPTPSSEHVATASVSVALPPNSDTRYFFRVVAESPTNSFPPFETPAPLPSFFTGAQTVGDVFVDAGADRARLLWDANIIGLGRVAYGTASPDELSADDQQNATAHSVEISGLSPGTTYQYRVCNRHAIDGDCLAAKTGSFTTLPLPPQVVQAIDDLRERVASYGLPRGTARSLDAKLEAALAAWQAGDTAGACGALSDFLNEVRAQAGKKLSEAQAQQLTAAANDIRARIGC